MRRLTLVWVLCPVLLIADEPAEKVPESELRRLIAELDADTFLVRERASQRLLDIGEPALAPLDRAIRHPSAEVRRRAEFIQRTILRRHDEVGFRELAKRPDDQIDLEYGMWLISRILHPTVSRSDTARKLDDIADRVRQRLGQGVEPKTADPRRVVEALRHVLFMDLQFRGNAEDYMNPDNSSLARVLDTRKGLPILLSHVVIAVAVRLGVPIVGLPTPGRYIVKYDGARAPEGFAKDDLYLDPYGMSEILTRAEVQEAFPSLAPNDPIKPSSRRESLVRMLTNLETHLYHHDRTETAQRVLACKLVLMRDG